MLKVLKEGNENFAYVYDNIKTMGKPTDQLFETIYREVLKLAEQKKMIELTILLLQMFKLVLCF